jgi:hypothetical protein
MRKYRIQECLVERDSPLATFLSALPDWERVYTDRVSALFLRKPYLQTPHPVSKRQANGSQVLGRSTGLGESMIAWERF